MNDFSLYLGRAIILIALAVAILYGVLSLIDAIARLDRKIKLKRKACILTVQSKYKKGCYHGELTLYCPVCGHLIHVSANEGFINARCCGKQMQCIEKRDVAEPGECTKTIQKEVKQSVKKAITAQEVMSKLKKGDKNNA